MAPAKEERLDIAWLVTYGKRTGVYNAENKAEECKMATFYYYCHWILMFEAGKYTIHLTITLLSLWKYNIMFPWQLKSVGILVDSGKCLN